MRISYLFTLLLFWSQAVLSQTCVGNYYLNTQADVDNFGPCTTIDGDLRIGTNGNTTSNITNIANLNTLVNITGTVQIVYNPLLTNLNGLDNLNSASDGVLISENGLTNIDALSNLSSTGTIFIRYNDFLTNIDGLSGLSSVDFDLSIQNNNALTDIDGLQNIVSVGRDL